MFDLSRFNHDFPFQILQDCIYITFTARCDMKSDDTGHRIQRFQYCNPVIGLEDELYKSDFPAVNTVIQLDGLKNYAIG